MKCYIISQSPDKLCRIVTYSIRLFLLFTAVWRFHPHKSIKLYEVGRYTVTFFSFGAIFDSMLKIKFTDNRQEPIWVMEKSFTIGRSDNNQLIIEDPSVSDRHAIILNQGEKFLFKDSGSQYGTFVNGDRITQRLIACGDKLGIGNVELEVVDPLFENSQKKSAYWSLIADSSWLSGQEFPLKVSSGGSITLGRGAQCDIVFAGTHLSRTHAEVSINTDGSLTLKDLGSSNGTFVNEKRVTEAKIYPGDRIRLDLYSFKVFGPGIQLSQSATAMIPAVSETSPNRAITEKQWKSRPTSVGNREEINLYEKNYKPMILAGLIITGVISAAIYIGLSMAGVFS